MPVNTLVAIALTALLVFWTVGAYNRLIRLQNTIANAFGQVDVQLKRRHDLVSDLVEAARKYLLHEVATLDIVTLAHNKARSACDTARSRPTHAAAATTLAAAEQALTDSMERLFAVAGACPELKADNPFRELREALTSTDQQVTFAQQVYNVAVLDYNNAQGEFPAVLLARLFGFAPSALLQASPSADPL